ncbi:MAG TPA: lytic transglycosylase domain-containing protein [Chitinophagaceae bacterium]
MKKLISPLTLFLAGSAAGIIIISLLAFRNEQVQQVAGAPNTAKNDQVYNWTSPPLPSKIDFAGEEAPLHRWEVKEQLDREVLFNYYYQNNILYMLKLAGRYFPLIEERLKANGLPDDFKYLCIAESNLANAISRAGAVGFWQFMKGTAPGYDIEITDNVDERYHVTKSTDAACQYLRAAYSKFGSWTAAAASYNCGMGGFNSHSTFQQTTNYYDLILPDETQRYIFRILAFKYLMTNADKLGYRLPETERYKPVATRSITVTSSIPNLSTFAREQGTTYKMLKWHNPWLRSRTLPVKSGKSYVIVLPAK